MFDLLLCRFGYLRKVYMENISVRKKMVRLDDGNFVMFERYIQMGKNSHFKQGNMDFVAVVFR